MIPKIIAFVRMKEGGFSNGYNCCDPITNEVIRLGNEKNKTIFTYNKICLFSDVAILSCFILAAIYLLISNLCCEKIENIKSYFKQKERYRIPDAQIPIASEQSVN